MPSTILRHSLILLTFLNLLICPDLQANELKPDPVKRWEKLGDSLKVLNPDSSYALARLILREARSDQDRAYAKYLAGIYFYRNQQLDTAYTLLAQIVDSLGVSNEQGTILLHIGRIFSRQSNFKYAEHYHREALHVFEKTGTAMDLITTLNGMGIAYYNQGNYTEALNYYSKAKSLALDSGVADQHVRLLNNIVGVYCQLNQFDKALAFANEAYALAQRLGDPKDVKTALIAKGYVFKRQENLDSAIFYYELGVANARDAGDFFSLSRQLFDRADLFRFKKDFKRAINDYKEAIRLLEENREHRLVDQMQLEIADLYKELGKPDSAIYYSRKAYDFAIQNNIKWSIERSSFMLGDLYKNRDPKTSIRFYEISLAYKDSIYNEKSQQEFSNQRVKLETIEKSKEIQRLQNEAKIAQIKRSSIIRTGVLSVVALLAILVALSLFFLYRSRIQKIKSAALERELERNKRDLHIQTMNMIRLNNELLEMEENLKSLRAKSPAENGELQKMIKKIQISRSLEKEWESFNLSFGSIHQSFMNKLREVGQYLTQTEIRLCTLLKLNLSNSEISSLLNIESKSVRMSKYRLKKRLGLSEEADITAYLQAL